MIKKHSWNVTKILAINFRRWAVNLKESYIFISVKFITWRVPLLTFFWMSSEFIFVDKEGKTKITNIEALGMILMRQSSKIPGLEPMFAEMYGFNCLNLCLVEEYLNFTLLHTVVFIVEQILLFFFQLQSYCSIFFLFVNQVFLPMNFFWINQNELLCHPSIQSPVNP